MAAPDAAGAPAGEVSLVFDADPLGEDRAAGIRPHDDELSEVAFLSPERAGELLRSRLRRLSRGERGWRGRFRSGRAGGLGVYE